MKQATGRTTPLSATLEVSIRPESDGHSFSICGLDGGDPSVPVEVLTPRTILVPAELFDFAEAERLLAAAGLAPAEGERAVWSAPQNDAVAVMAAPRAAVEQVRERLGRLGGEVRFTTPLLGGPQAAEAAIWMRQAGELLYIKVYDPKLCYAEVIPASTDADRMYLFERLAAEFPTRERTLLLADDDTKRLRKMFGGRFKRVSCA